MEIIKAIADRRALRALSSEPLPPDAIKSVVEAGALAPSCFNNQPWRMVIATGDALGSLREALAEGNAWATRAPAIVALAVREADDCRLDDGRDYALFDAGLCAMGMMVQATAIGVIAHPIAGYNPKKAKVALGIPPEYVLAALIVLGLPGSLDGPGAAPLKAWQRQSETGPRERKPLADVAFLNRWGGPLS